MMDKHIVVSYGSGLRELPGGLNKVGFDWCKFYNEKNVNFVFLGSNIVWKKNYKELPYFNHSWIVKMLSISLCVLLLNYTLISNKRIKIFIHYIPILSILLFPSKSKIKWFLHGDYILEYRERGANKLKLLFLKVSKKLLFLKFRQFNAYNNELRLELLKIGKKVSSHHNAVECPKEGFEVKENLIISYAYWNSRKNLESSLNEFKRLNRNKQYRLVILGGVDQYYQKEFNSILKEYGERNVEYIGYVDRCILNQYLGRAKFFILMSEAEGFPLSFLEAFSYRCIVICSQNVSKSWVSNKICLTSKSISLFEDVQINEISWSEELSPISIKKIQDLW